MTVGDLKHLAAVLYGELLGQLDNFLNKLLAMGCVGDCDACTALHVILQVVRVCVGFVTFITFKRSLSIFSRTAFHVILETVTIGI